MAAFLFVPSFSWLTWGAFLKRMKTGILSDSRNECNRRSPKARSTYFEVIYFNSRALSALSAALPRYNKVFGAFSERVSSQQIFLMSANKKNKKKTDGEGFFQQ
jgi:hypothetical protein